MAKAWKDVIASQQYQALSPQQRAEAQEQYFNDVVAPQAGEAVNEAKQQFYTAYPVETVQQEQQPAPVQQQEAQQPEGFWANVKDMVTGESRMTPEMEKLQSVSDAPELSEFNKDAAKVAWAQMMGNQQDQEIMLRNLGAEISYDAKGNAIVTMPEMVKPMGWLPKHHADKLAAEYGGVAEVDGDGNTVIKLPPRQYALNKPGLSPEDVASGAALAASYTPAGRAGGLVSAGLRAAGTDALIQGTTSYMGGTDIDPFQVGLSGVLGTGGKAFENIVGAAARAIKGKMSPEAAEAVKFADANNAPLMTTDAVQPGTFSGRSAQALAEKIPVTGTGALRRNQQEARSKLIQEYSESFAAPSPDEVVQSLQRQTSKVKQAAGKRMSEVDYAMQSVGTINPTQAITAIDNEMSRLARLGGAADTKTINKLQTYRDELVKGADFSLLRDLRTQFRQDVKGDRMVWPSQSQGAVNRVYDAMSKDINQSVSDNLGARVADRYRQANAAYAHEAQVVNNTRLKSVLQKGELTPEVANNLLFSNKKSEVQQLYRSLDSRGRNAARASVIGKAYEKSGGSPEKFLNEINRLSAQTGILFKGSEKQYLNGLKKYLEQTQRASRAGTVTPTGQELLQVGIPAGVAFDVVNGGTATVAALSYGALARVYESKPIRNMMLRLANTPKGSTAYDRTISNISQAITALSQAEISK
ncbi:lytic transglycosylase domain-containing protein [Morganella morganii]|uniref:lytic transglycosylase domain-containing protein n=1 Tax=Morganella morganii TaxID=582 RepID=UPI0032DB1CE8